MYSIYMCSCSGDKYSLSGEMMLREQTLEERFSILVDSAKYDVSCASSGSERANKTGSLGNTRAFGICHSWATDGRCISLLKLLQTNKCAYECAYCVNRVTNDIPRASLSPEEIADITMNFYRRNYIEGLFLSSAVQRSPDYSTEMMIKTVELLRKTHRFNGYIHVKGIPGADERLVRRLCFLADRISFNIELPSANSLAMLAPQKNKQGLVGAMRRVAGEIDDERRFRGRGGRSFSFVPAGQSTQMIIGASPDSDRTIISLSEALYRRVSLRRVYYSAYIPVGEKSLLPVSAPPLLREHRLYQADWLLRFYGFSADELLSEKNPNFDLRLDPKAFWALNNLHLFPVDINRASLSQLLRVPGIGLTSAQRIVASRKCTTLDFPDLKRIGVVMKRARFFITCKGRFLAAGDGDYRIVARRMLALEAVAEIRDSAHQLPLFAEETLKKEDSFIPLLVS